MNNILDSERIFFLSQRILLQSPSPQSENTRGDTQMGAWGTHLILYQLYYRYPGSPPLSFHYFRLLDRDEVPNQLFEDTEVYG